MRKNIRTGSFEDVWRFIVKVGVATHRYGSTTTRLESFLAGLSKRMGYRGVFRSTPSDTGRPTSIVLIPAIVMLVSGSIGFRGLASMAGGELLVGAQQFLQMFVVAMTIVVGILVGYTIICPESGL